MENESAKHGPREDEDLKRAVRSLTTGAPVEARSVPYRLEEDPAPGPPIAAGAAGPEVADPADLDAPARELRAELAARTAAVDFPTGREALVAAARRDGADDALVATISTLSDTARFSNLEAVWEALGGAREQRG